FALEFGDYKVAITVPADHIVSATGELTNASRVLTAVQQRRMREAAKADKPVFIVTPEEAKDNEASGTDDSKTWVFEAENVRDFAFSSSRKYIWDAMGYQQPGANDVMAMSFYPNEAEPIWSQYSTEAIVHTMEVYSRFSFPYPYPTSQSVNARKSGGMEYPMITSNGYRPEPYEPDEDDQKAAAESGKELPAVTYSRRVKYGLIGVIIHEVGHNYFPMIVNSDERQWTWMDEGLNSFLEYVAEFEWEENFPAYGEYANVLDYISGYMVMDNQVPVMTQSDSILQFGNNAYSKPTAALIVLRETVMGRERFDYAFREYANRWKFKRPTPSDFFRTMEDASGMDLDWFWRGWFYSTDHVDVAISNVRHYQIASGDPDKDAASARTQDARDRPESLTQTRNREAGLKTRLQQRPALRDFYNDNDRFTPNNKARNDYQTMLKDLEDWERQTLERAVAEDQHIYFVDFENIGGLVTPLPLQITFASGKVQQQQLPAQIWRRNHKAVTRIMIFDEAIKSIALDVRHETADADYANNHYPRTLQQSNLALYKSEDTDRDLMAHMLASLRKEQDTDAAAVPLTPSPVPQSAEPDDAQQPQ
ncbi:MAG: M1 family aminopeptidase, partial [Pseudomonadales bacterium]